MAKTQLVNTALQHLVLAIALAFSGVATLAQDQNDDEKQTSSSAEQPRGPVNASADNTRPAAERDDSPFDYQASEEISQDLSVSFPVDI